MRDKVFVAQPIPEVALDILREVADVTVYPYLDRQISQDELIANAKRCDWLYVLGDTIVSADVINANPDLKAIGALTKVGINIDIPAATARNLPIVKGDTAEVFQGGVSLATADLTVGMILGLAYRIVDSDRYTRAGQFKQEQTMALMGQGCPAKTVGLIGMGAVARFMVPRLKAFDMKVIYTKRHRLSAEDEKALGVEWVPELDTLIAESDYLSVQCDYNESTHCLIGEREFGLMKKEAYFINTARGRIVDEKAMTNALQDGVIAGAALDVYWDEPPYADPYCPVELTKLDNVILAPHNGGATWEVRGTRCASVSRDLVRLMKGERPKGLLNPETMPLAAE